MAVFVISVLSVLMGYKFLGFFTKNPRIVGSVTNWYFVYKIKIVSQS